MSSGSNINHARQLINDIRIDEAEDNNFINLCAYDNALSNTAAEFLTSPLSFRYRIGTFDPQAAPEPDKQGLILRNFTRLDELERAAHQACLTMFGGVAADLRPLSGVHATLSILLAATNPGDIVYSIDPKYAGHFATRHIVERAGRRPHYLAWDETTHSLAIDAIASQFKKNRPDFILLDHSAPIVPLNIAGLRELAGSRTVIDFDASHSMGLIAGGLFQNPLREGCDILHGNTHKSFPGPQKALIVFNDWNMAERVQTNLDAGLVSSLHTHHLIALCVTLLEMELWGSQYATQIIKNANALRDALAVYDFNFRNMPSNNLQSHVLLIDTPSQEEGYNWFERLRQAWISTNVRPLFGQTIMRLGVQEVSRRGFTENDMLVLATAINAAIHGTTKEIEHIGKRIMELRRAKTQIRFSFDDTETMNAASLHDGKNIETQVHGDVHEQQIYKKALP